MTGLLPVIEWNRPRGFSCQKTGYTKREAQTAMNARMNAHRNRPESLRIYPCPTCRQWHLTSKEHRDE